MSPSALLGETRSQRLPINLPFLPQLRVSPTVRELLDAERPANETWADFALLSMLQRVLIARTIRADYAGEKSLLVMLLGAEQDSRAGDVTGGISDDERAKQAR